LQSGERNNADDSGAQRIRRRKVTYRRIKPLDAQHWERVPNSDVPVGISDDPIGIQ